MLTTMPGTLRSILTTGPSAMRSMPKSLISSVLTFQSFPGKLWNVRTDEIKDFGIERIALGPVVRIERSVPGMVVSIEHNALGRRLAISEIDEIQQACCTLV